MMPAIRFKHLLALGILSLVIASCQPTVKITPVSPPPNNSQPPSVQSTYIGLSEVAAAQKAKLREEPFRIVERDGSPMIVTKDYRPGRINATSNNGSITKVRVE